MLSRMSHLTQPQQQPARATKLYCPQFPFSSPFHAAFSSHHIFFSSSFPLLKGKCVSFCSAVHLCLRGFFLFVLSKSSPLPRSNTRCSSQIFTVHQNSAQYKKTPKRITVTESFASERSIYAESRSAYNSAALSIFQQLPFQAPKPFPTGFRQRRKAERKTSESYALPLLAVVPG